MNLAAAKTALLSWAAAVLPPLLALPPAGAGCGSLRGTFLLVHFTYLVAFCQYHTRINRKRRRESSYSLELTSLTHSLVAVFLSAVGICTGGTWASPGMVRIHSYAYFAFDLFCNFAGHFNGGFSMMYTVHHVAALVLLWFSHTYQLDGVYWGIVITEVTNPVRAWETLYLMDNYYSPMAKRSRFRRTLKWLFTLSFALMRLLVLPVFTARWFNDNYQKVPTQVQQTVLLAMAVLMNLGGCAWASMLIHKTCKTLAAPGRRC